MAKTSATTENLLVLCELYFLAKGKSTTTELAKFLNVTARQARKFVRILKERGILKDLGQVYELEKLSDKTGFLLVDLIHKFTGYESNVFKYIKELRDNLITVYDLLYEAREYCTDECGNIVNYEAYERIDKAINILDDVLTKLTIKYLTTIQKSIEKAIK